MLVITGVCIIWTNKLVILKDITSFKMILGIEFIGGLGNALYQIVKHVIHIQTFRTYIYDLRISRAKFGWG